MKMKKLLACLLAATVVTSTGCNFINSIFPGGSSENGTDSSSDSVMGEIPEATNPQDDFQAHYVEGMLHDVNVDYNSPANLNFIKNGQTEYKFVVGTSKANEATAYMKKHFNIATECVFESADLDDVEISENSTYIFIGCTELIEEAGFIIPEYSELGVAGYYIVTYGKNVFIQAYGEQGYQMAGLCFLRQTIGFDVISTTTCIYEKDGSVLPKMEITERPDFDYRQQDCWKIPYDVAYGMGYTTSELFLNTGTSWMHNVVDYLGGDVKAGKNDGTNVEHRKWFSNDTNMTQACFTAHGDKEEYQAMVDHYVKKVVEFVKANPRYENIVIGQMDVIANDRVSRCTCESCDAAHEYYGDTNAGIQLAFTNEVSRGVDEWLKSEEGLLCATPVEEGGLGLWDENKEIHVIMLVYGSSINPPISKTDGGAIIFDENGLGVPKMQKWFNVEEDGTVTEEDVLDEEGNPVPLVCAENADLFYCASSANYLHSFYEAENISYSNMVKGWAGLGGDFYVWTYEVNYYNYMYPYNSYDSMLENLRYFKSVGANHLYYQASQENANNTAFAHLRSYIFAKGLFDVNVDYEEVVAKWFKYQFSEAGDIMREYFNQVVQQLRANESYTGGSVHSNDITKPIVWPEGLIRTWYGMINKALATVEHYKKTDPVRYEQLWTAITAESLFPRFVLCTTYGNSSSFSNEALIEMRKSFAEDFKKLGNTTHREHTTISDVFSSWEL